MLKLLRRIMGRRGPRERKYFGLDELDRRLESYVNLDGGVFVEAGANDGMNQSNTLYFERCRGWSGLLVEPNPELANKCRRNRPRAIVESLALVPFNHSGTHIEFDACGLMGTVKGAMQDEQARQAHLHVGREVQRMSSRTLRVPCEPLSEVLTRLQIDRIDLLSLDVEGFELQVLQGIDFDLHSPQWMLIEARFRQPIDEFLSSRYHAVAQLSHHDVLYRLS